MLGITVQAQHIGIIASSSGGSGTPPDPTAYENALAAAQGGYDFRWSLETDLTEETNAAADGTLDAGALTYESPGLNIAYSQSSRNVNTSTKVTIPNQTGINSGSNLERHSYVTWIQPESITTKRLIYEQGGSTNWVVIYQDGDDLIFSVGEGTLLSGTTIHKDVLEVGETYFIGAYFHDNPQLVVSFVNDQKQISHHVHGGDLATHTGDISLFATADAPDNDGGTILGEFQGHIQDHIIYSLKKLTDKEFMDIYYTGIGSTYTPPTPEPITTEYTFQGYNSSRIETNAKLDGLTDMTIVVKGTMFDQYKEFTTLVGTSNSSVELFFGIDQQGDFRAQVYDGTNASSVEIVGYVNDQREHTFALVYDDAVGMKIYEDGVEIGSNTNTTFTGWVDEDLTIGGASTSRQLRGEVKAVQVYDTVLSPAEITTLHTNINGVAHNKIIDFNSLKTEKYWYDSYNGYVGTALAGVSFGKTDYGIKDLVYSNLSYNFVTDITTLMHMNYSGATGTPCWKYYRVRPV